jgi:hypothetical protein
MSNQTQETVPTQFTEAKGTSLARELFTSNFWMSGLAMLKYIPRSFRVKQVDGMAFFTESKHHEFRNWHARSPDDWGPHPMFGKMTLSERGKLLQIRIDNHLKQFAA